MFFWYFYCLDFGYSEHRISLVLSLMVKAPKDPLIVIPWLGFIVHRVIPCLIQLIQAIYPLTNHQSRMIKDALQCGPFLASIVSWLSSKFMGSETDLTVHFLMVRRVTPPPAKPLHSPLNSSQPALMYCDPFLLCSLRFNFDLWLGFDDVIMLDFFKSGTDVGKKRFSPLKHIFIFRHLPAQTFEMSIGVFIPS